MREKFRSLVTASCLFLLALAGAPPASAWEWSYGPAATWDDAFRRVTPVPACGVVPAGYIAVGTQDPGTAAGNADVYVVRTDVNGDSAAGGWEATYDVQGLALRDDGMAIVPVPGGYVFLSNSLSATGFWRPALTRIDCLGNVVWSQIYFDITTTASQNLWGNDLIRTQTGNAGFGTAPGDLAVAGRWWNGGNDDAFLMRTNAAGNLIWNIAHNTGLPEVFNALAEALPVAPETTGDLVAVGRLTTTANDQQGLVARVNGNNGGIGAAPQCYQHHGGNGTAEVYNSVVRLQVFFPGQFAFAGTTTDPTAAGWLNDVWVTRGNTCGLLAQARFGNPGGLRTDERGHDMIEVRVPKPGVALGTLAVGGDHAAPGAAGDGALMLLTPGLVPVFGQNRIFGDFGPNVETIFSLAEDPAGWPAPPGLGYVLAGLTQTPWTPGDPQDMYLVHHNPAVLACEKVWEPIRVTTGWPQSNLGPLPRRPARHAAVPTPRIFQLTGKRICAP